MTIPRHIHQIWFQGADAVPRRYQRTVAALKRMNPGWTHTVWDDGSLRDVCHELGFGRVYDAYTVMHQKIDFGRYCVLYKHGGVSLDMDVDVLRPLDALPLDTFDTVAVSKMPLNWFEARCANKMRGYMLNNATILSPARDPLLRALIVAIARNRADPTKSHWKQIDATTGPSAFNDALWTLPVIVMDSAFFEPCIAHNTHCAPTDAAIVYHQHHSSWNADGVPYFRWYYAVRPYFLPLLLLVIAFYSLRFRRKT